MGTFKFSIIGVEKSKENGLWGGLGDSSYTQLSCCCTESIGTGSHTSRARAEAGWGTGLDAGSTRWPGNIAFDTAWTPRAQARPSCDACTNRRPDQPLTLHPPLQQGWRTGGWARPHRLHRGGTDSGFTGKLYFSPSPPLNGKFLEHTKRLQGHFRYFSNI